MLKILYINEKETFDDNIYSSISKNQKIRVEKINNIRKIEEIGITSIDLAIIYITKTDTDYVKYITNFFSINKNIKIIILFDNLNSILNLLKENVDIARYFSSPFKSKDVLETIEKIRIEVNNNDEENRLINIIDNFPFNKSSKGYKYILDCLLLCVKNNYYHISNLTLVYKKLCKKYNKNVKVKNISWNISKALNYTNKYTNSAYFTNVFHSSIITPKLFFNTVLQLYYLN